MRAVEFPLDAADEQKIRSGYRRLLSGTSHGPGCCWGAWRGRASDEGHRFTDADVDRTEARPA